MESVHYVYPPTALTLINISEEISWGFSLSFAHSFSPCLSFFLSGLFATVMKTVFGE